MVTEGKIFLEFSKISDIIANRTILFMEFVAKWITNRTVNLLG